MENTENRPILLLLLLCALVLACGPASAEPVYIHPRAMAMGAAYTSIADDTGAMEFNPAGLGQKKYVTIDASYQRIEYFATRDDDDKTISDRVHLAVADARTSKWVAAGVSFTADGFPNDTFKDNANYQALLSLAFPAPEDLYAFGMSAKYVRFDEESPQDDAISADLGFILTATPWFHFGLAGRNLVPQEKRRILPSELAAGVSSRILGYFTISFDTTWGWEQEEGDQWNFHIGAEALVAGMIALRAGYFFDEYVEKDYYSAGIAYQNDMGAIGYTFRNNPEQTREFTHAFQVMIRF